MRNKTHKLLLITGLAFLLFQQSCISIHSGNMSNISYYEQDETWVDIATARTKVTYFIWIGGNAKDIVLTKLKSELMLRYKDSTHLGLRNFILNERITNFSIYTQIKYTMSADVFKLKHPKEKGNLNLGKYHTTQNYSSKTIKHAASIQIDQTYTLQVNDKVYFYSSYSFSENPKIEFINQLIYGTIIELKQNYALVSYFETDSYEYKIGKIAYSLIYKEMPFSFIHMDTTYKNNDIISFMPNITGKLILFNEGYLLFSNENMDKELSPRFFIRKLY